MEIREVLRRTTVLGLLPALSTCTDVLAPADIDEPEVLFGTAPTRPGGLRLTQVGERVVLAWNDNSDTEDKFIVQRRTDPGDRWTRVKIRPPNSTSWTDYGTESATTYWYRVRACLAGEGCQSTPAKEITTSALPRRPRDLAAYVTSAGVALTWTDVATNEDKYIVQRRSGGSGWARVVQLPPNSTAFVDTGAPTGVELQYRVRACLGGVGCANSNALSVEWTPLTLETSYLPGGYIGSLYSESVVPAEGGTGTYAYYVTGGALPSGLALNPATGIIYGSPVASGMAFFEITAVDSGGLYDSAVYGFSISTKPPGGFNLAAASVGDQLPTTRVRNQLSNALAKWERAITTELGDVTLGSHGPGACDGAGPMISGGFVDDAVVLVDAAPIDGPGGTLAYAGPCITGNSAPYLLVGQFTLDSDDSDSWSAAATYAVILHEIGHVLGIGAFWDGLGLLADEETDSPGFTGTNAKAEFATLLGDPSGYDVPVEDSGGPGTALAHWDEGWFDDELMTGWSDGGSELLSRMSIASLVDLGWPFVNLNAAQAYSLPVGCAPECTPAPTGVPEIQFIDSRPAGPIGVERRAPPRREGGN